MLILGILLFIISVLVIRSELWTILNVLFEEHDLNLIYELMPIYDSLHNKPHFQALCREISLPYK